MSRILKAPYVNIDQDNRVSIRVMDASVFEPPKKPEAVEMEEQEQEETEQESEIEPELAAEKIIENAYKKSEAIQVQAQKDAQSILQDAREQAESLIRSLKEEALAQSREEGYAEGLKTVEALKNEAEAIRVNALREREETLQSMESEIIDLIIGIVDRLLGGFNRYKPDLILCLIRQGVSEISSMGSGNIHIHVSAEDYEAAIERKDEILSLADTGSNIDVLKDLSLHKSDCIIETPFGNIDCSLDQQFQSLKENLYYILGNR